MTGHRNECDRTCPQSRAQSRRGGRYIHRQMRTGVMTATAMQTGAAGSVQKVTEQPALKRRGHMCSTDTWQGTSGRENSMCKGPEAPENTAQPGISKSPTLARQRVLMRNTVQGSEPCMTWGEVWGSCLHQQDHFQWPGAENPDASSLVKRRFKSSCVKGVRGVASGFS